MPLIVKITESLSNGFFKAVGKFSSESSKGDAIVLLQKSSDVLDSEEYILVVNDAVLKNLINGKKVKKYTNVVPVSASKSGKLTFKNFYIAFQNPLNFQ